MSFVIWMLSIILYCFDGGVMDRQGQMSIYKQKKKAKHSSNPCLIYIYIYIYILFLPCIDP
ncbi:hypothetical protein BC941DRAFT_429390 [Chlamydoabsidia padenii]|nr:hypothetical protein BC941DRAFT_429390 [Chlamydoabsidia padenii]